MSNAMPRLSAIQTALVLLLLAGCGPRPFALDPFDPVDHLRADYQVPWAIRKLAPDEPRDSRRRISLTGVDYGPCDGVMLAVYLVPEPCGWPDPRGLVPAGEQGGVVIAPTPE